MQRWPNLRVLIPAFVQAAGRGPSHPHRRVPAARAEGLRSRTAVTLLAWLMLSLLGAQCVGLVHDVGHAGHLASAAAVDDAAQPSPADHRAPAGLHHHCHLYHAGTLAACLPTSWRPNFVLPGAAIEVAAASTRHGGCARLLAFRSQAPPVEV